MTTTSAELSTDTLADWVGRLSRLTPTADDAERVDRLRILEELKSAAAAAQARVTVEFDASHRATQAAAGVAAKDQGAGVAAQVALARRDSPARGGRHLGFAKALVREMPCTLEALSTGRLSEWRATLLVRETACLRAEHRTEVDRRLASDPDQLDGKGDRQLVAEAKKLAYRLDPGAALRRVAKAESDRRVSIRPAPDTMTYLSGLLPVAQGVAAHAALTRHADAMKAQGDPRTRGQIMADTLVERLTGQATAPGTNVEVQLVMTDSALLGTGAARNEPAHLTGHGPIPAELARRLVAAAGKAWVRRLFARPSDGELAAADSRRRLFPESLRGQLIIRDQACRTPWCDAPIRHSDHVVAVEEGGSTTLSNGQGLCEACNHAKQATGWRSRTRPRPGRHRVEITTPTGHRYASEAPPLPGHQPRERAPVSVLEQRFRELLAHAA